jgi:hypothetical protein
MRLRIKNTELSEEAGMSLVHEFRKYYGFEKLSEESVQQLINRKNYEIHLVVGDINAEIYELKFGREYYLGVNLKNRETGREKFRKRFSVEVDPNGEIRSFRILKTARMEMFLFKVMVHFSDEPFIKEFLRHSEKEPELLGEIAKFLVKKREIIISDDLINYDNRHGKILGLEELCSKAKLKNELYIEYLDIMSPEKEYTE